MRKLQSKRGSGTQVGPVVGCEDTIKWFQPSRSFPIGIDPLLVGPQLHASCSSVCCGLQEATFLRYPFSLAFERFSRKDAQQGRWEMGRREKPGCFSPPVPCLSWCFPCSSSASLSEPLPLSGAYGTVPTPVNTTCSSLSPGLDGIATAPHLLILSCFLPPYVFSIQN